MHTLWKHTPISMEWRELRQETAASLGFCTCFAIVPVTAAVFHFAYFTSTSTHVQCCRANRTPPLLVCESHDVHASSFPISWFSHVLGHCDRVVFARAWLLFRSAQLCFICVCYIVPGRACEANDQRSAQ